MQVGRLSLHRNSFSATRGSRSMKGVAGAGSIPVFIPPAGERMAVPTEKHSEDQPDPCTHYLDAPRAVRVFILRMP